MKKIILLLALVTKSSLAGTISVIPVSGINPYFGGKNLNIVATDYRGKALASCRSCNRLTFTANGPAHKQGSVTITGGAYGRRNFSMRSSGKIIIDVSKKEK